MLNIANTPAPPYYAVIAPTVLRKNIKGYPEMAARLIEEAKEIEGFLGIESCFQGNFVLAVSYWRSLEAIQAWRKQCTHLDAKNKAKTEWFDAYMTRIARVERAY